MRYRLSGQEYAKRVAHAGCQVIALTIRRRLTALPVAALALAAVATRLPQTAFAVLRSPCSRPLLRRAAGGASKCSSKRHLDTRRELFGRLPLLVDNRCIIDLRLENEDMTLRQLSSPVKYKKKVADALRGFESRRSWDNVGQLDYLSSLSDDEFLRRWMWIVLVVGCPLCFIALPLLVSVIQVFLAAALVAVVWTVVKLLMAMMLLLLIAAIYMSIIWRDRS